MTEPIKIKLFLSKAQLYEPKQKCQFSQFKDLKDQSLDNNLVVGRMH